ncbi:hypothetical protein JCM24511_08822 [Saitozyma sp. JCM 24511]|nr:hypothetical protein JCM24511_08822 [Saitozyma sp. JCM 24511]
MTNPTGDEEATRVTTEVFSALGAYGSHNGRWGEYQGGFARGAADENTITEQVSDHAPRGVNGQPQLGQLGSRSPLLLLDASVFASRFTLPASPRPVLRPGRKKTVRASASRRITFGRVEKPWQRGSVAAWQRGSVEVVARANGKGHRGEGRG